MKEIKTTLFGSLLIYLALICALSGYAQQEEVKADSLFASRLMQDNLELYAKLDSLSTLVKTYRLNAEVEKSRIDSLQSLVAQYQAQLVVAGRRSDTLESQRIRLAQNMVKLRQEILDIKTMLEKTLQSMRDKEFLYTECQAKLHEAEAAVSLNEARFEGKNDVSNTKIEAREREIAYMKETITEKDRIISEKTTELSGLYRDKSNSLRILDSLSRTLNNRELELAKVSEHLRIIESQYNEMVAAKTAAQNKKKKVRFVQGFALKSFRTPDYQLTPKSSSSTATYVITNKNAGKVEIDYITGVSLSMYDLSKPDGKYTYDAGLFFGFGGTNFFKNFYISPSVKAFDYFHFMLGLNVAEYELLQSGFSEGDVLPPGMSIPTVKQWKANVFFGMTIDFELLANMTKKF